MTPNYKELLSIKKGQLQERQQNLKQKEDRLTEIEEELKLLDKVNVWLTKVVDLENKQNIENLTDLINTGLSTIFTDLNLRVEFESSIKNNRLNYKLKIFEDEKEGVVESFGGGVLAVISMIMRLFVHRKEQLFPLIVFDESLSFVSQSYRDNVANFLKKIAQETNIAIVQITHNFGADTVYELHPSNDGVRTVKR